jgi:hypothetical protein
MSTEVVGAILTLSDNVTSGQHGLAAIDAKVTAARGLLARALRVLAAIRPAVQDGVLAEFDNAVLTLEQARELLR